MAQGSCRRSPLTPTAVLALAPVVLALTLLAGLGLTSPRVIGHLDHTTLTWAVLVDGVVVTGALGAAAVRARPASRLSWWLTCAAAALWSTALLGALREWPDLLTWGVLRGAAAVAAGGALLAAPGVRRTGREWGLLLLDGWLVGGSVLLVGWVALRLSGSPLGHVDPHPLAWVPIDLVLASVVAGLAGRTGPGSRLPAGLLVLSALLAVTSDSTWALTASPRFGVVEWLIMLWALGSATLTRRLDVWTVRDEQDRRDPARPRFTRFSQAALVPGLLAATLPGADVVTFSVAVGLVLGLAVELLLLRRQHDELWEALHLQARRLDQLFRESRDVILQVDPRGRVEFVNDAVSHVLGYDPAALLGRGALALVHPEDRRGVVAGLGGLADDGASGVRVAGRFRHGDGGWRHLESTASRRSGPAEGYTLSVRDVSERNRLEAELRRLASTDALTGLLNRRAFLTVLAERASRGMTAVLFIDLDGFKTVNDTDGHEEGDRVLCRVADTLRATLRPGDVAARLGGDEFAVLPAARTLDDAYALATRLAGELAAQPRFGVEVGASIGVAAGRRMSAEALLRRADRAMYAAKAAGGGLVRVHAGAGRVEAGAASPVR